MQRNPEPSLASFLLRSVLAVLVVMTPSTPMWAGTTLRRSGSTVPTSTSPTGSTGGTAVTPSAANVKQSIKRSAVATDSVAHMQAAMRDALAKTRPRNSSEVTEATDLTGALILWQNASVPSGWAATKSDDGSIARIKTVVQTDTQAFLRWSKFDLSYGDTLYFNQSAGGSNANNWVAYNYVRDPSASPSQIYGSIKAEGQVYIINANGIIFGGTAQVNTHALVASSLPINPNLLKRGLLVQNTSDVQFLFSGLSTTLGNTAAEVAAAGFDPNQAVEGYAPVQTPYTTAYGSIQVLEGAQLTATNDKTNHTNRKSVV